METKRSSINREMGKQIRREQSVKMSVRALSEKTGISEVTINRMWSANPRDINITQITWLAALMGRTPQELVENAVKEAGGLGAIMHELEEALKAEELARLSEAQSTNNVTQMFQGDEARDELPNAANVHDDSEDIEADDT